MRIKSFRAAAIAAVATAALVAPALADHSWSTYHWQRTSSEVRPEIVTAIDEQKWGDYVRMARTDWNKSIYINSPGPNAAAGVNPKNCKAISGKILVCNARYGQTGWLGVAQIWLSGGHIVQGITKLNDTYFDTAKYNTYSWRALVTCQEIGHDYGLGHQDEDFKNDDLKDPEGVESCMDYTDRPVGNEHPNQHDYDQLETIYNHPHSSFTAVGPGKSGSSVGRPAPELDGAIGGDSPAEWGRAVDNDAQGRPHVFVQDLGGGKKKITHVFWTLETKRGDIHH